MINILNSHPPTTAISDEETVEINYFDNDTCVVRTVDGQKVEVCRVQGGQGRADLEINRNAVLLAIVIGALCWFVIALAAYCIWQGAKS